MKGTMKRSLEGDMDRLKGEIINAIYPVGAIYISVSSTSPETLFGGSWEQIKDRFLLAAGSTYEAGSTGGKAKNTIDASNLPSRIPLRYSDNSGSTGGGGIMSSTIYTNGEASGYSWVATGMTANPIENMPPYLTVCVWKRVA